MDAPAHIFWTWAIFKVLGKKIKKPLNMKLAIFWGIFPDLFAFSIPILLLIAEFLLGKISLSDLPGPTRIEPPQQNFNSIVQIVSILYSTSHSLVIFSIITIGWIAILYSRRKNFTAPVAQILPIEMAGWMLHILIDIPTHSTQFYSTPFLWPISNIKFSGISWGTPWFLALNYAMMIIVYFVYFRKKNLTHDYF